MKEENNNVKVHTIESYIKSKEKLLSTFAIFIALTLFTHDKSLAELSPQNSFPINILSFIFFSIGILIWIELWVSFPKSNLSFTLKAFKFLIDLSSTYLVMLWFTHYLKKGLAIVVLVLAIFFAKFLDSRISKQAFYNNLKNNRDNNKIWRGVIMNSIRFLIFLISLFISGGIAYLIYRFLLK